MGDGKDSAPESVDERLNRQIRSHYLAARQDIPVPPFDAVMARAEAETGGDSNGKRTRDETDAASAATRRWE